MIWKYSIITLSLAMMVNDVYVMVVEDCAILPILLQLVFSFFVGTVTGVYIGFDVGIFV